MSGGTRRGTPYLNPTPALTAYRRRLQENQAQQAASQMASTNPSSPAPIATGGNANPSSTTTGGTNPPTPRSTNAGAGVPKPRVGGITPNGIAWTGGSSLPALALSEPETARALRSKNFRDANDTYSHCTKGIESKLDMMDPRTKEFPTPLMTFQNLFWEYLKDHGMDTVFRIILPSGDECCLVMECGRFYDNYTAIQDHVADIKSKGCPYDKANLAFSAKAVWASLGDNIRTALNKHLKGDESGPELYYLAISHVQSCSSVVIRDLITELSYMRLDKHQGQNVPEFVKRMTEIIHVLESANKVPEDVSILCTKALMNCSIMSFQLQFTNWYNECIYDQTKYSYSFIIQEAERRYNDLVRKNEWLPGSGPNPVKPNPASFHSNGPSNEGFQFVPSNGNNSKRKNKKKNRSNNNDNRGSNANTNQAQPNPPEGNMGRHTSWKKVKPSENDPKEKTVNGKKFYWCSTCNRWTTSHSTETHRGSSNNDSDKKPPPTQRAYPFFAASFLSFTRPLNRNVGRNAAATALPNQRSNGQTTTGSNSGTRPESNERATTAPNAIPSRASRNVDPMLSARHSDTERRHMPSTTPVRPTRTNSSATRPAQPVRSPSNPSTTPRTNLVRQARVRQTTSNVNNTVRTPNRPPIQSKAKKCNTKHNNTKKTIAATKPSCTQIPSDKTESTPETAPSTPEPIKSKSKEHLSIQSPLVFLPISFLVFSLTVMLSVWWVSSCLKAQTGQPYSAFYPNDPTSFYVPNVRLYRHPPDKRTPSYKPRESIVSVPSQDPPCECRPPIVPQLPTFQTAADIADSKVLDELIDSLGPSYVARSALSIHDDLSFYSTSDVENFLIIDTGATSSSSFNINDFEPSTYRSLTNANVHGISGTPIQLTGVGFVTWTVRDTKGNPITLRSPATHIPESEVRLFSPQRFFQTCDKCPDDAHFSTYRGHSTLWFEENVQIACNHPKGLPVVELVVNKSTTSESAFVSKTKPHPIPPLTIPSNQNLSNSDKLLLLWHNRLGHIGFDWVHHLASHGFLGSSGKSIRRGRQPPKCAACIYARQHCRPTTDSNTKRLNDMKMKKEVLQPGQLVAVDQFVCSKKGRLLTSAGRTGDSDMYCGGTIFIDLATQRIKIYHQASFSAADTVRSKQMFERDSMRHGVPIKAYQSDNGVFTAVEFVSELEECMQAHKLAGVGAHHHNGIVENAIRTITERARAMMLHSSLHWPEVYDDTLWPNAMSYAVQLWNHTPRHDTNLSPEEIFSSSIQHSDFLHNTRVWGCPAYVLDSTLHDGKKIPRWQPRSRRGQFVGFSDDHPFTVGFIRNLDTERITPQFHVVYDHQFETTYSPEGVIPPMWADLVAEAFIDFPFGNSNDDDTDPPPFFRPDVEWLAPEEREQHHAPHSPVAVPATYPPPVPPPVPDDVDDDIASNDTVPTSNSRRPRSIRPPQRYMFDGSGSHGYHSIVDPFIRSALYLHHLTIDPITHVVDVIVPHLPGLTEGLFSARKKRRDNPDTPMYHQAMHGPHRKEFEKAMTKELDAITDAHAWTPVLRSQIPTGARVVPGTWSFRIKRFPDGRVRSFKARYNIRGDLLEHGVDFTDSPYAPLVQWSTVRLMLLVGAVQNLTTCCVDFKNAFAQAPLDDELYLELPQGFDPPDDRQWVLRLEHSLYGHPGSSHIWSEHLAKGLLARGFKRSSLDPCLFIHPDMVCLVYCDDCLWWAKDPAKLHAMLDDIDVDYPLTKEAGDVYSYLGVEVRREGEYIKLTQTGLIQDILASTFMTGCGSQSTPANIQPLGSDTNGDPPSEPWSYASIIGKLNYLANNTRPDIAFSTHQCARYTHRPKRSHEIAVKKIVRYLQGTANQGLRIKINQTKLDLTCFSDADFAGLWGVEDPNDPVCTKSRSGYVIFFGGCPLVWASKLQTDTALSTMEAEYIALSQSMRELIPLRALVAEILDATDLRSKFDTSIKSTVFEDNQAAISHAVAPKMSPRTKHIAVKYHFFRHHIASGEIEVVYVDTNNQVADLLTKGLPPEKFRYLREKLMGW